MITPEVRCSQCGADAVPVSVDAGGGPHLPLFITDTRPPAPAVQSIRPPLMGFLCPNCGLLRSTARLSSTELASYLEQTRRAGSSDDRASSLARTRVKGTLRSADGERTASDAQRGAEEPVNTPEETSHSATLVKEPGIDGF